MTRLTRRQRLLAWVETVIRALAIILLALVLGLLIYSSVALHYDLTPGYIMVPIYIIYNLIWIIHLVTVLSSRSAASLTNSRPKLAARIALEVVASAGAIGAGLAIFIGPQLLCPITTCDLFHEGKADSDAAALLWATGGLHYVLVNLIAVECCIIPRRRGRELTRADCELIDRTIT
ncbi:hypothetical protein NLG97_g9592 [Lecanicillium saksenae]|uniref:Uncharacterized protein n=1 Tax=Lecanicillium saksenae TaxID=468837 RepID=A0ACC1QHK3_9HYPO|nr:hypothetical protein NLG97_g9592 [Lecanicillium saksenae]